jgi:hypothetical protein
MVLAQTASATRLSERAFHSPATRQHLNSRKSTRVLLQATTRSSGVIASQSVASIRAFMPAGACWNVDTPHPPTDAGVDADPPANTPPRHAGHVLDRRALAYSTRRSGLFRRYRPADGVCVRSPSLRRHSGGSLWCVLTGCPSCGTGLEIALGFKQLQFVVIAFNMWSIVTRLY